MLIEKESATFTENNLSEVEIALNKYKNHPSINAITKRMKNLSNITFNFNFISHDDVVKELNNLKSKKAVTPIHKKDDKTDKTNYCPISILPNLSKVYERLMYNQISPYFDSVFSKFQCGFWKGFNAQHFPLTMVEKWRKTLDEGGKTGAVLTDPSKAFDYFDHNLLTAKINAYGFEKRSLEFIHSYLTKRKQRTKVGSAFSSWELILSGVPQGSILGPLLFNIYIWDMFFETPENIDFAGYADDNTPYTYSSKIEHVLTNLQSASENPFPGFLQTTW